MRSDRKRQTHIHAAGITLNRCVNKCLHAGKIDDLIELALDLATMPMPRMAPFKEDILTPGQFGMKTCSHFQQAGNAAPSLYTSPLVGAVTRERILNRVLFPAPLRPIIPKASPCETEN